MKSCTHRLHEGPRELPYTEFNRSSSTKDGLHDWCRTCIREYRRETRRHFNSGNEQLREDMGKLKQVQSILMRQWT